MFILASPVPMYCKINLNKCVFNLLLLGPELIITSYPLNGVLFIGFVDHQN